MNADGDTLDNGDYTTTYAYDQNGNMTDKDVNYVDPATPDEAWDFAYNEDDLLEAVVKDASTVAEYNPGWRTHRAERDVWVPPGGTGALSMSGGIRNACTEQT